LTDKQVKETIDHYVWGWRQKLAWSAASASSCAWNPRPDGAAEAVQQDLRFSTFRTSDEARAALQEET